MHRGQLLGVCLLIFGGFAFGETRWIRMRTDNFEVYSSAGEGATRTTLRDFEQVREFFLQLVPPGDRKQTPVYIVAFNSPKEYAPYRPGEFAAAHYQGGTDRDYIVMGRVGYDTFPIAVHEYVHLVVQHAGLKFPPWLNEGLAELYSTLKPRSDKILIGDLIAGRMQALQIERWVPLGIILSADHNSPYYNEKNKAGNLYNEGWALVHMLMLSERYRDRFSNVLSAIHSGADSQETLEQIYGKPLDAIETDLRDYLAGNRFVGRLVAAKLQRGKSDLRGEPVSDFDVNLVLTELADRPGKEAATRTRFEELTRQDPKRPEPWSGLAYLAWRKGDFAEAVGNFGKAYGLGARSPKLLWDYGRLAGRDNPAAAFDVLNELSKMQPDRVEVRLELAAMQLSRRQAGGAYATLQSIKKVGAEDAPRLFSLLAYSQLQLKEVESARTSITRLEQYAKTDRDKAELEQLKRYIQTYDRVMAVRPTGGALHQPDAQPDLDAAPRLQSAPRAPRPDDGVQQFDEPPSQTGTFSELICLDNQAKIVLKTGTSELIYLIQDPARITVMGREGGKVDLECGPQKPAKLRVEYTPPPAGVTDIDGVVRILFFE
jgi:hypothetical protein